MLPFCQRYKTAPMSQRALISLGSRENYSLDCGPWMATLLTKHFNLQIIHPFCLAWRVSLSCKKHVELAALWIVNSLLNEEDAQSDGRTTTVKYAWDSTWYSIWCELTHFNYSEVKMKNIDISSLPNELERNKSYSSY
jgi:hypothetical protein